MEIKPGDKFAVDWREAVGKTFVAKIKTRQYENKDGETKTAVEIDGVQMFHPTEEEVAKAGLAIGEVSSPVATAPSEPAQQTQQQPPAAAQPDQQSAAQAANQWM